MECRPAVGSPHPIPTDFVPNAGAAAGGRGQHPRDSVVEVAAEHMHDVRPQKAVSLPRAAVRFGEGSAGLGVGALALARRSHRIRRRRPGGSGCPRPPMNEGSSTALPSLHSSPPAPRPPSDADCPPRSSEGRVISVFMLESVLTTCHDACQPGRSMVGGKQKNTLVSFWSIHFL